MNEVPESIIWMGGALAAIAMICATALKAWRGWLELRHEENAAQAPLVPNAEPGHRIELADVKERLRKLEALARGVEY